MFRCLVTLLDDTHIERNLEKGAVGQVLFDKVCEHLNLLERDYFGLAVWYTPTTKVWLDFSKEVSKQIIGHDATLTFNVKFYPPDPSVLAEDITRYLLCLQLRIDILTCRLSCPLDVLAELGSFAVQSEFGEYDSEKHGQGYLSNTAFTPHQTPELLDTITELHRSYKSMSPAQADKLFLQKAKNLPMYGVDLHPAMDNNRGDVMLGVCAEGLNVYEDETQTDNLPWPKVLKMSYKRNRLILQILQEEDASENTVMFKLPNYRACKSLWKTAVEHHAFFRNHQQDRSFPNLLHLGSKFRFHGNTHIECLEASSNINRPPLHVARSAIKRKAKESMLQTLKRPNRTELDDWFQVLEKLQPSFGLEMYKADESSPVYRTTETKTYRNTHKVTWTHVKGHSYEEGEEGEEPEGEEPQLPSGQTFPLSVSFSSDTNILKSAVSQSCKQQVDDWFDILNPEASKSSSWILETALWAKREVANQRGGIQQWEGEPLHRLHTLLPQHTEDDWQVLLDLPSWSPQQTPSASFQSSQPLEQRQELEKNEWEEKPSEDSVKVVKIMKEVQYMTEGSEIGAIDIAEDSLKMGIGEKQPIMKDIEERLEQGDGQPRDVFAEQNTRRLEIVNRKQGFLVAGGQVISDLTIEELDKNILKGENSEQRLQDIEGVKVRLEEREILEQKLQQAQQEQGEQRQQDDWHILIEPRPLAAGAKREVGALQRGGIQQPLHRLHTLLPQHTEDDWHVLLDLPSWSPQQTPSASFQSSQPLEQRQELEKNEWEEKPSEDSVKVVKILKEVQYMTEGSEGLEVQTRQESADITGDSLKMGIGKTIMKIKEEKLEEQGDGERFQNVIMYQQRTQEIQSYDEQPRDVFVQGILKIVERKQDLLVVGGQVASEETIEELENKLREVESIEQKLQDIEGLKVRLREVEILEQKLQQAEQKQGEQRQRDDWHILMDCRPQAAGAKTEVTLQRGRIQRWEGEPLHKLHTLLPQHTEDDWHVLLDLPPRSQQEPPSDRTVVSMVTEGRKWEEESIWQEERRENQVTESRQPIITGQSVQTRMDIIDDWFVQLNLTPKLSAPPMTVTVTDEDIMAQKNIAKEERRRQVVVVEKPESRILLHQKRAAPPQREGHDDWFILLHASPLETVPVTGLYEERVSVKTQRVTIVSEHMSMKGRGVMIDEKPTVIREKLSKVTEVEKTPAALREIDDNWFVLFDWTPFERRGVAAVEESDARPSQERRVREAQERRIRDEERRKQEACALLKSMPEPPRHGVDDWFVLLKTPPKGVGADRRGPEDQSWKEEEKKRVLKEEQKKRVMEEERKKRMMEDWRKGATVQERRAAQPPWEEKDNWFTLLSVSPKQPVPVISPVPVAVPKARPLPPADQPLTSTPTTQPAPVTRPTYQEERTKRLDITQESEVEIESVLRRQRKAKRIEGETIFIRHSILMLEDFDVTPEVVIRHHASIRELKRIFLEDMPVYGPTEWDKRLSTHSPVKIPKLTNGDLFLGMEIMADGVSVI